MVQNVKFTEVTAPGSLLCIQSLQMQEREKLVGRLKVISLVLLYWTHLKSSLNISWHFNT